MQTQNPDDFFDMPGNGALFESVLSRRIVAFCIDFAFLFVLSVAATVLVLILGVLTLGLGWLLIPVIYPVLAILYVATTIGGSRAATYGMRFVGLEARMIDGRKPEAIIAIFHALAFYFSMTVLTPLVLLLGLFTRRQRLLHDYVSGILFVNSDALPQN